MGRTKQRAAGEPASLAHGALGALGALGPGGEWDFVLELALEEGGEALEAEPVREADVLDAESEVWWRGFLRRGQRVSLEELRFRRRPVFRRRGAPACAGFQLTAVDPSGRTQSFVFSRDCLEAAAARAADRLARTGRVAEGAQLHFELRARQGPAPSAPGAEPGAEPDGVRVLATRSAPPELVALHLAPLLERSRAVGEAPDLHAVFYTEEALGKAERVARRGGAAVPPVESGGLLVGRLCSCPESGEAFVVVCDVIEAAEAEERKFSLAFTGRTWARIQAVMRARQHGAATRGQTIVGQTHGHNFLPLNGAPPCEACATQATCGRSSAYLSLDDLVWCRAVFAGQPWQVSHVFGLNARGEPTESFYGQAGGLLRQRGYRVVSESALRSTFAASP